MADFRRLSEKLRAVAVKIDDNVAIEQMAVADAVLQELVAATPVRSGRSAENWHVSIGAPADRYDPSAGGGPLKGRQIAAARDAAPDVFNRLQAIGASPGAGPGGAVYIDNAVPYIWKLSHGESKQAPAGWIEEAVRRGVQRAASETRVKLTGYDR